MRRDRRRPAILAWRRISALPSMRPAGFFLLRPAAAMKGGCLGRGRKEGGEEKGWGGREARIDGGFERRVWIVLLLGFGYLGLKEEMKGLGRRWRR